MQDASIGPGRCRRSRAKEADSINWQQLSHPRWSVTPRLATTCNGEELPTFDLQLANNTRVGFRASSLWELKGASLEELAAVE